MCDWVFYADSHARLLQNHLMKQHPMRSLLEVHSKNGLHYALIFHVPAEKDMVTQATESINEPHRTLVVMVFNVFLFGETFAYPPIKKTARKCSTSEFAFFEVFFNTTLDVNLPWVEIVSVMNRNGLSKDFWYVSHGAAPPPITL